MKKHEISTDFAWSAKEMSAYHEQYRSVSAADSYLAGVAIKALTTTERGRQLLGQLQSATIIGAGGVPRGAGILLPTLQEAATLTMTDSTPENTESTRRIMEGIKNNDPAQAHWLLHEEDMEQHDPRWAHAIGKAALLARYEVLDLRNKPKKLSAARAMEYVGESQCETKEEYENNMDNFTAGAEELVYQALTVKSGGWKAGDKHHPAYSVSVEQNAEQLERNGFTLLHDPLEGFAPRSSELRQEDDEHDYAGFAVAVAVRD